MINETLKIYRLFNKVVRGYDTYDSCLVVARNEDNARGIHPGRCYVNVDGLWHMEYWDGRIDDEPETIYLTWCQPPDVEVIEVGYLTSDEYQEGDVIVSSFNAG